MNDMKTELMHYSYIENTRILYKLMTEIQNKLEKEPEKYIGNGGLKKRANIVSKIQTEIKNLVSSCYVDGELLYQNTLSNYFVFWKAFFGEDVLDNINEISSAYNYFRQINSLYDSKILYDDLPYIFEDICFSICEMVHAKMCYFRLSESNNASSTIAQSGDICTSLDEYSKESEEKVCEYIKGVKCIGKKICISMPFNLKSADRGKKFQIVLYTDREIDSEYLKNVVSKILFMRKKLFKVIDRLFAVLLNYQTDYEYIKPINQNKRICILHLSDIHITLNKKWDTDSNTIKKINRIISKNIQEDVDFIAITGDIIQAANNAEEAQRRYESAEKVVLSIAKAVWGVKINDKEYLPHDWKKRIIINTGNHDYAAMNDVVVQTQSRVIKSAIPSKDSGGTMSKFTYFLEFLQRFLNLPIEGLIKNDINEIRRLRNFKLNIIALNSISLTNSMQNNKVGLNKSVVQKIVNRCEKDYDYKNLLLSHHSPNYTINYFEDIYNPYALFDTSEDSIAKKLYDEFSDLVCNKCSGKDFTSERIKALSDALKAFDNKVEEYQKSDKVKSNEISDIVKNYYKMSMARKKEMDAWISLFCQSDLYFDIKHLCNYVENDVDNEFSTNLYNKLRSINDLCKTDRNAMKEIYDYIFLHLAITVVLSGHEHKQKEEKFSDKQVYIANKLEKEVYLITINEDDKITRKTFEVPKTIS